MVVYSHSKISTYEQCALKYKFNYIDKIKKEKESVEAFLGKRVHETLEFLYKNAMMTKVLSLKQVLAYYKKNWKENLHKNIEIVKKFSLNDYYRKGEKFIKVYYENYKPFDENTIALEKQVKIKLNDKYILKGYIDRLVYDKDDKTYEIHDYKTNNELKTQDDLDQDRQLALYSIAVKEAYKDANKIDLVWHFLAFDKEFRSFRSLKEIEKLKKETIEIIKEIEKEKKFEGKVSALCNYCEFITICPKWKHKYVKEEVKEYGINSRKLVDECGRLEKEKKEIESKINEIKEKLIKFAVDNKIEVIFGKENKASVKEYVKIVYPEDKEELKETLKKMKIFNDYVTLNYMKLNSDILKEKINLGKIVKKEKGYSIRLGMRKE